MLKLVKVVRIDGLVDYWRNEDQLATVTAEGDLQVYRLAFVEITKENIQTLDSRKYEQYKNRIGEYEFSSVTDCIYSRGQWVLVKTDPNENEKTLSEVLNG